MTAELEMTYQVLKKGKQALYFRDLLTTVLNDQGIPSYSMARAMVALHTQVNMDSRFAYRGQGKWGLSEWISPQNTVRATAEKISAFPENEVHIRRVKLEEVQQLDNTDAYCAGEDEKGLVEREEQGAFLESGNM